jgi:hypothetical protein
MRFVQCGHVFELGIAFLWSLFDEHVFGCGRHDLFILSRGLHGAVNWKRQLQRFREQRS